MKYYVSLTTTFSEVVKLGLEKIKRENLSELKTFRCFAFLFLYRPLGLCIFLLVLGFIRDNEVFRQDCSV